MSWDKEEGRDVSAKQNEKRLALLELAKDKQESKKENVDKKGENDNQ